MARIRSFLSPKSRPVFVFLGAALFALPGAVRLAQRTIELAPFTPEEEAAVESFVSPRIAREAAQPEATPAKQTVAKAEAAVMEKSTGEKAAQTVQASVVQSRGISQLAASLPPVLTLLSRTPTLAQARGIGAYQPAGARNAAVKREPEPEPQPRVEIEPAL